MSHAPLPSHRLIARLVALATALAPAACSTTINPEPSTGAGNGSGPGAAGSEAAPGGKQDVPGPSGSDQGTANKRVFLTSVAYNGNLAVAGRRETGVEAADALCQLAADAAELGGTFKAFLGDSSRQAGDNLADVGPWYTVPDGAGFDTKVFNNKANLATLPLVPVVNDERGAPTTRSFWVGDRSSHCDDWLTSSSSSSGKVADFQAHWHSDGPVFWDCNSDASLLCFQQ